MRFGWFSVPFSQNCFFYIFGKKKKKKKKLKRQKRKKQYSNGKILFYIFKSSKAKHEESSGHLNINFAKIDICINGNQILSFQWVAHSVWLIQKFISNDLWFQIFATIRTNLVLYKKLFFSYTQQTITILKSTIEALEEDVEYVQC